VHPHSQQKKEAARLCETWVFTYRNTRTWQLILSFPLKRETKVSDAHKSFEGTLAIKLLTFIFIPINRAAFLGHTNEVIGL
jgi:hypothetical protein